MKALIYFQPTNKLDFEGSRLRKTIKGALELNNIEHTSNIMSDYDIIHLIGCDDISLVNEADSRGIPCVVSALTCEADKQASYLDYKFDDGKVTYTLKNKVIKYLNKVDHVIVPCENGVKLLKDSGVTSKISAVMPGVNLSRFDFNRVDEKELFFRYFKEDNSKKLVISTGDGEYMEGFNAFINAAEKCPEANFYFFLNGKLNSIKNRKTRNLIKHGPKNLHVLEMVNDDIYRSALINASIFMLPCYHMSGVVSILEAMGAKCEIIMRSQEVLPAFIKDNETVHIGKFSETLTSLCVDCINGKLRSTVTNAYEEAQKYNLHLIGEKLAKIYQDEINLKRGK